MHPYCYTGNKIAIFTECLPCCQIFLLAHLSCKQIARSVLYCALIITISEPLFVCNIMCTSLFYSVYEETFP